MRRGSYDEMVLITVISCLFLSKFYNVICAPLAVNNFKATTKALDFMKKFGYIDSDNGESEALFTEEGISEILKSVQKFGAIEETGVVDEATLKLMSSPRCGNPDVLRSKRKKRYVTVGRWEKRNITYSIVNWSPKLKESDIKYIQLALDTWGSYGRLCFQRSQRADADILVYFGRRYHGDEYPFDGRGSILAHAFFPSEGDPLGGDIHFDEDEHWTADGSPEGTDLYSVALHESGHSLGLAHSPVPTSVMFPYYKSYRSSQLDYDDILAMYKLYVSRPLKDDTYNPQCFDSDKKYGFPESDRKYKSYIPEWTRYLYKHKNHDTKHTIPDNNFPSIPDICNGKIDAVATLRNELFVFKDQYVWRFREKGKLEPGYPVPLWGLFQNLPRTVNRIDAAYQRPDGMIVLFSGKQFWVYDGVDFTETSHRLLTDYGLPSYLQNIDAVQSWSKNGKTYFYKGDRFWRYNETSKAIDPGYPLHMERWSGVPENLDAATTWQGITYFFKDDMFWTFDNDWVIVSKNSPLPTAQIWLACPEDHRMRLY